MSAGASSSRPGPAGQVICCDAIAAATIDRLLGRYGVEGVAVPSGRPIPGSYWGAPEAGLVASAIYFRDDTPVHSLLHELAHYICMDASRRLQLDTNAGGNDDEECGVCYLEVLLAAQLPPFDPERCLADMDTWGYSFREGAAARWFRGDGAAARRWLMDHDLIDADGRPNGRLRA